MHKPRPPDQGRRSPGGLSEAAAKELCRRWPCSGHCARSSLHRGPRLVPSLTCDHLLILQMGKPRLAQGHMLGLKSKLSRLQRPGSQLGHYRGPGVNRGQGVRMDPSSVCLLPTTLCRLTCPAAPSHNTPTPPLAEHLIPAAESLVTKPQPALKLPSKAEF